MKKGLVLGKFMPFHKGHANLIKFAQKHCDYLIILICVSDKEIISGEVRYKWLSKTYKENQDIEIIMINYNERELPNTSVSSKEVSRIWADFLIEKIPKIDFVFTSEKYRDYLSEYLNCQHLLFDLDRKEINISSTAIQNNIFQYWGFLPKVVQPYFVKKVAVLGTESTGKTVLVEKLARHFHTSYVPEMAREIIAHTEECKENHLQEIAELHAMTIKNKLSEANKILFVDTDLNITRSYSKFLFNKDLLVPKWVEDANDFNIYLYLSKEAVFVQDGTRLEIEKRNLLDKSHQEVLKANNIQYHIINGDWQERFDQSIKIIKERFFG